MVVENNYNLEFYIQQKYPSKINVKEVNFQTTDTEKIYHWQTNTERNTTI